MPLQFETNVGQAAPEVQFLTRAGGGSVSLTSSGAVLRRNRNSELRMRLLGARSAPPAEGIDRLPGKVNYFRGRDRRKWHTNIPTYSRVRYRGVYPGIDLVYYGNRQQLEYDFVVRPGAAPGAIRLAFPGAEALRVDASGDLLLLTAEGAVRQHQPRAYQEVNGVRREVSSRYRLSHREVRFELGAYDATQPLIIDPSLSYSTWLGGAGDDQGKTVALDGSGNVYLMGTTRDPDADLNIFLLKLDPTGTQLLYAALLGGSQDDYGNAMAVDASGNVYLTGLTYSYDDFPVTGDAIPTSGRIFVTKINSNVAMENSLVYSTLLPGNEAKGIAVDRSGSIYLTGNTGNNFLVTPGAFQTEYKGGSFNNAFVMKLNPSRPGASAIVYSTYLGSGNDTGYAIAVDQDGNAVVTGSTFSSDFPVVNAYQKTYGGGFQDAFVTKLNAQGSALIYSTYLGSSDFDAGYGVALDAAGNAYVTGVTYFSGFPTTPGAFQTEWTLANCRPTSEIGAGNPCSDAFVTKLSPSGGVVYSTYLGGHAHDVGNSITVDGAGDAYVTGQTISPDFPTADPMSTKGSGYDAFVTVLSPDGSGLLFSTYIGGGQDDSGQSIALDADGLIYVAGRTSSPDFPVKNPAQDAYGGGLNDAFLLKIGP